MPWAMQWAMQWALPWTLLCVLLLASGAALAHKPSDSYLTLSLSPAAATGPALTGQWDIALRDLDFALGLDADGDGNITWGEVRLRHDEIAAYALARLSVSVDGARCTLRAGAQQIDEHTDGAYTVLPLQVSCPEQAAGAKVVQIGYTLFGDLDPQHRGLLNLQHAAQVKTAVLTPGEPEQSFELSASSLLGQLASFVKEGVWHIWIGFDHILFLLALLLPAVGAFQRKTPAASARWVPSPSFGPVFWDVLRVVTAFTVAHSVTLSLATLGWVALPSRWVESTIAASVVLAALNNVWPVFQGRRWMVAFFFGLIHGFGFASVLADLQLPQEALALALLGFNVGVELGQLAIVLVFLPIAFAVRRTDFYRRGVLWAGSLAVALIASLWFVERAFGLSLLAR